MRKLVLLAGMPRSGSTLLCNLLNMNPEHYATATSPVVDVLRSIRKSYSHNITFKTNDRPSLMNNMREGLSGYLNGFYYDREVVFDKSRGWPSSISLMDEILGHKETKMIWTYRDPVEIFSSIEAQYQKTILLENNDEASVDFSTLERRVDVFTGGGGLINRPVALLSDAFNMGYSDRILLVRYGDLTHNPQGILEHIHDFIGEPQYAYNKNNFTDLKQTTVEHDNYYNYKFLHTIREGGVHYKKHEHNLPDFLVDRINERFTWLNGLMKR